MKTIEDRLRKLEVANRRYRLYFFVSLSSFALLFMGFRSQIIPDVLQARKFEVVDPQGNVLVRLAYDGNTGYIKTFNSQGNKLVNINATTGNQGFLALEDGNGNENVRLSTSREYGGGSIFINNKEHNRSIILYNDEGGGSLSLNNNKGNSRVLLKTEAEDYGYLTLYNSSGKSIISMMQTSIGNGDLYLHNVSGDDRIRLSSSPNGGVIHLFNLYRNKGVELGLTNEVNGVVSTFNSNGQYLNGIGGN